MPEQSGNGPVKILMRNGVRLKEPEYVTPTPAEEKSIYEGRRPQDKRIAAPGAQKRPEEKKRE